MKSGTSGIFERRYWGGPWRQPPEVPCDPSRKNDAIRELTAEEYAKIRPPSEQEIDRMLGQAAARRRRLGIKK